MLPDSSGHVDVDGVGIGWEQFGDGSPTFLLLPTWSIVHSRLWKAQVPYLARHHRVVTFDAPGNGRSDRVTDPAAYGVEALVGATTAVLGATGTAAAVLVSASKGAYWSLSLAATHPELVLGQVFIGPGVALTPLAAARARIPETFLSDLPAPTGWEKYNARHWRRDLRDFAEFFFGEAYPEPHSTKQREDAVGWALETDGDVLVADAIAERTGHDRAQVLAWCAVTDAPVLVVHGDRDRISPVERAHALAAATGGDLVVLEGCGHLPMTRDPVTVNRLLAGFARRVRS